MRKRWIAIICVVVLLLAVGAFAAYHAASYRASPVPVYPGQNSIASTTPVATTTSPTQTASSSPTIVTLTDNGSTVRLHIGDRFTLELGEQNWTVNVGDQSIVRRLPNFAMIRGAQGIYQAYTTGTTTLSAIGRPVCDPGMACPAYVIEFKAIVEVK